MPCRCEGKKLRLNGTVINLSYGGAGIGGTDELPSCGSELMLTLRPSLDAVKLRSRVIWTNPEAQESGRAQFGEEFTEPVQDVKEKLKSFFPSSLDW
jgi:hypothetical protein